MNTSPVTKETEFLVPARRIMSRTSRKRIQSKNRRFRAIFSTKVRVCVMLWDRIGRKRPPGARQEHLLWALLFLKTYGTEHVNSMICSGDEKTFRKWSWKLVILPLELPIVRFHILLLFIMFY